MRRKGTVVTPTLAATTTTMAAQPPSEAVPSVPIFVVTDNGQCHDRLDRVSQRDLVGMTPYELLTAVNRGLAGPAVVIIDGVDRLDAALRQAADLDQRASHVVTVLIAETAPEVFAAALRTGVRDLLPPDADDQTIAEVVERAVAAAVARTAHSTPVAHTPSPFGRVITITSPKGGSGKTTVTTNLAVELGARFPSEVVVVDLDLQFGDVASCLRLEPEHTVVDAVAAGSGDSVVLKSLLTSHPSGCYVLAAPASPADGERVTAEGVADLIQRLAAAFRFVLIDTAPGLLETTLAALEHSDDVVLLAGMDVPSVRGLHRERQVLDELGLLDRRQHLVVNFVDRRAGLDIDDVERTLQTRVDVQLPRSRAVPLSTNRGVPLLAEQARGPVVRGLRNLADAVGGHPATVRRARRGTQVADG